MTSECDSIGIKNDESYTMSGVSLERINLKWAMVSDGLGGRV
jgi:hypothetical protein